MADAKSFSARLGALHSRRLEQVSGDQGASQTEIVRRMVDFLYPLTKTERAIVLGQLSRQDIEPILRLLLRRHRRMERALDAAAADRIVGGARAEADAQARRRRTGNNHDRHEEGK